MTLCNEHCIPCCDFCIHCIHDLYPYDGVLTNGEPIGCYKHFDEEHNNIAAGCGYCEDFHCVNVK